MKKTKTKLADRFDEFERLHETFRKAQSEMHRCAKQTITAFVEKYGTESETGGQTSVDVRAFFLADNGEERNEQVLVLVPGDVNDGLSLRSELLQHITVLREQRYDVRTRKPRNQVDEDIHINTENLFLWENQAITPEIVWLCRNIEEDIAEGKAFFADGILRYHDDND